MIKFCEEEMDGLKSWYNYSTFPTALFQWAADRKKHFSLWISLKRPAKIGNFFWPTLNFGQDCRIPLRSKWMMDHRQNFLSKLTYFYLNDGCNILVKKSADRWFSHDLNQGRMELPAMCTFTTTDGGIFFIFFCLGFFFTNNHNSQDIKGIVRAYCFNSSLTLLPASQTLWHWPGNYCREFTSARS